MPLEKHQRNQDGTYRKERGDATAGTLRKDYPEFNKVRSDKTLEAIRKESGKSSINDIREYLRKNR